MTYNQLKQVWAELENLGCNEKLTEKIFIKIIKGYRLLDVPMCEHDKKINKVVFCKKENCPGMEENGNRKGGEMNEKGDIVKDMWQQMRTGLFISTTYFFSNKERLRMTVKRYDKKIPKKEQEYILSYGKPNYAEREFIKKFPDLKWMFKELKK